MTRGPERAPEIPLAKIARKGRTVVFATAGSEELRYLDVMGANANVGGENLTDILFREDARTIEAWEEFLHGTQKRCGMLDQCSRIEAEIHVKDFMVRHRRILGLDRDDVALLSDMIAGLRRE